MALFHTQGPHAAYPHSYRCHLIEIFYSTQPWLHTYPNPVSSMSFRFHQLIHRTENDKAGLERTGQARKGHSGLDMQYIIQVLSFACLAIPLKQKKISPKTKQPIQELSKREREIDIESLDRNRGQSRIQTLTGKQKREVSIQKENYFTNIFWKNVSTLYNKTVLYITCIFGSQRVDKFLCFQGSVNHHHGRTIVLYRNFEEAYTFLLLSHSLLRRQILASLLFFLFSV